MQFIRIENKVYFADIISEFFIKNFNYELYEI